MTLVYPEGDFEAFLTAVLETWVHRTPEWGIVPDSGDWFGPEGPWRNIKADPAAARRVLEGVANHGGAGARRVLGEAFRHAEPGKETALTEFIRSCVRYGRGTLDRESDPEVREVLRRSRAVRAEAHRFLGLVRFQTVSEGGWYGRFEPDHDVLGMLVAPFGKRMEGQDWVLHDAGRRKAWVQQADSGYLAHGVVVAQTPQGEPGEGEVQALWQRYFSSIAIRDRTNPTVQRSKMPLKTWKNLVERPGLVAQD